MKEKGQSFYDDFLDPLWHAVNWVVDYIGLAWQGLQETWDGVSGLLVDSWHGLQETWHDTVRGISGQVLILEGWWNTLVAVAQGVVRILDGLWNGWVLHFAGVAIRVGGLSELIKSIWNGIVTVASGVVRLLDGLWNGFTLHFSGVAIRIGGIAQGIEAIWNGLNTVVAAAMRGLSGTLDSIMSYLETIWSFIGRIQDALARIKPPSNPIPGWVPIIGNGNAFVPVPAPPALAAGGIIPGSKWGTLVRAGENNRAEAIVPLSKMGGTTQNTYNITVDVAPGADPVRAGAAVVDAIRSYERANGRGWRVAPA
jgi:hypothetical protein